MGPGQAGGWGRGQVRVRGQQRRDGEGGGGWERRGGRAGAGGRHTHRVTGRRPGSAVQVSELQESKRQVLKALKHSSE